MKHNKPFINHIKIDTTKIDMSHTRHTHTHTHLLLVPPSPPPRQRCRLRRGWRSSVWRREDRSKSRRWWLRRSLPSLHPHQRCHTEGERKGGGRRYKPILVMIKGNQRCHTEGEEGRRKKEAVRGYRRLQGRLSHTVQHRYTGVVLTFFGHRFVVFCQKLSFWKWVERPK